MRFYATSTAVAADVRAIYRGALPGTRVISPRAAALKRFDVYLSADLLWATLPRGAARIQMFHGVAGKFQHDYDTPSVVHAALASVLLRQPPPHAELHAGRSD